MKYGLEIQKMSMVINNIDFYNLDQKSLDVLENRLLAPFMPNDTDFRPGRSVGNYNYVPLIYLDPRAVSRRLNLLFGIGNWSVQTKNLVAEYDRATVGKRGEQEIKEGLLVGCSCDLVIHAGNFKATYSNVGDQCMLNTPDNKFTSAWAQAFKRSAGIMGIGAYLYEVGDIPPLKANMGRFDLSAVEKRNYLDNDDICNQALKKAGFKSICEETNKDIDWIEAAYSMQEFGRVLSKTYIDSLKGK